jgi:hypothetical protein
MDTPRRAATFGMGRLFDITEHHHVSQQRRDSRDLSPEQILALLIAELILGPRYLRDQLQANALIPKIGPEEVRLPLFADSHQALVLHGAAQPRGERPLSAVLRQTLECLAAGVLHFVLGVGRIADQESLAFQAREILMIYEFAERAFIALARKFHQLFFGALGRPGLPIDTRLRRFRLQRTGRVRILVGLERRCGPGLLWGFA